MRFKLASLAAKSFSNHCLSCVRLPQLLQKVSLEWPSYNNRNDEIMAMLVRSMFPHKHKHKQEPYTRELLYIIASSPWCGDSYSGGTPVKLLLSEATSSAWDINTGTQMHKHSTQASREFEKWL